MVSGHISHDAWYNILLHSIIIVRVSDDVVAKPWIIYFNIYNVIYILE